MLALAALSPRFVAAAVSPPVTQALPPVLDRELAQEYWREVLPAIHDFVNARQALGRKNYQSAVKKLERLGEKGPIQDLALLELAHFRLSKKVPLARVRAPLEQILANFPHSPVLDEAKRTLAEAEIAAADHLQGKNKKPNAEAARLWRQGLDRLEWHDWDGHDSAILGLVDFYRAEASPLLEPFLAEAWNALSAGSSIRNQLFKGVPNNVRDRVVALARHRSAASPTPGVRAIQPDEELFALGVENIKQANWPEVRNSFRHFQEIYPESVRAEKAAYWEAQALLELGKIDEAKDIFRRLFHESPLSFHGLAGALRAGVNLDEKISTKSLKPVSLEGSILPRQLAHLWRARALLQHRLAAEARREFAALFRYNPGGQKFGQASASGSLALAALFAEGNYFPGAFFHFRAAIQKDASLFSRSALALFFPRAFGNEIEVAAEKHNLDPLLLYSLTKQESAFLPEARSSARALGLMQVLLGTGREVQADLQRHQLLEADTNVAVGAQYLARLLRQYDGNIAIALAGYNAGPSRARRWWNEWQSLPIFAKGFRADAFIELIPFAETKDYVASILRNYAWYAFLNERELPPSMDRLAQQHKPDAPSTNKE